MPTVGELAKSVGFRGGPGYKTAEPTIDRTIPVIDNSDPAGPTMRTSIDCYVTGQYIGRKGNVIEVKQRYTLYVSYSARTQSQTMAQARDRILSDFQSKYGRTFNVANLYIPPLAVPKASAKVRAPEKDDIGFYGGSELFRGMTSTERYRYDVGTEKGVRKVNLKSIKDRYGVRR